MFLADFVISSESPSLIELTFPLNDLEQNTSFVQLVNNLDKRLSVIAFCATTLSFDETIISPSSGFKLVIEDSIKALA